MDSMKKNYGLADPMMDGLRLKKSDLQNAHPIEVSEKSFEKNRMAADMEQLRKLQGIHAPLRIMMEQRATSKVGHLPCITQRSNVLNDVINGRDETMDPADFFGKPENFEGMAMPHAVIEKHLSK